MLCVTGFAVLAGLFLLVALLFKLLRKAAGKAVKHNNSSGNTACPTPKSALQTTPVQTPPTEHPEFTVIQEVSFIPSRDRLDGNDL